LLESRTKDRAGMPGLDDQRKDQIVAGALLVRELFERLKIKRIHLCGSALREGILLDYLARHAPDLAIRGEVPDPRRRSVIDLARRCDWHKTHSEQVASLAMRLFDELRPLHGMGTLERELIEYAALLHDIGWHIGRKGHHKHSMYLIQHGDLKPFTDEEVQVMAQIARYHRKSPPKRTHESYMALVPRARRIVDVGAALLRLADGLDRSHSSVIQGLRCRIDDGKVKCSLTAKSDAELEVWGARRKRECFVTTFKRDITFELEKR
jgi:exopolyphosphatase/guanosine-5'-triphosphate,3'-diphosphate pyrophosphatase